MEKLRNCYGIRIIKNKTLWCKNNFLQGGERKITLSCHCLHPFNYMSCYVLLLLGSPENSQLTGVIQFWTMMHHKKYFKLRVQQYITRRAHATMCADSSPRILGLRSMSLTGRRMRDLGSSNGRAVLQHCTLGTENHLITTRDPLKGHCMPKAYSSLKQHLNTGYTCRS